MFNKSLTGTIDDRYVILRHLGDGGMGIVFETKELDLERKLAVKLLHQNLVSDKQSQMRFKQEGKILSELSHKHIARCYRYGLWEQQPYIVMELLDGKSLKEVINECEQLSAERCLHIATQICEALAYLHGAGVVHRDLKPNNIMLSGEPELDFVKILDFGLARIVEGDLDANQKLTQTGELLGSVYYMSPEQATGRTADQRSDIYAFGCIMYEMLTGEPPLVADSAVGTLHKHMHTQPRALKEVAPNLQVPEGLEGIIFKCLQKKPEQRYQSVRQLAEDLRQVLTGEGAGIERSGPNAPLKSWSFLAFVFLATALCCWSLCQQRTKPGEFPVGSLTLKSGEAQSIHKMIDEAHLLKRNGKFKESLNLLNQCIALMNSNGSSDLMLAETMLESAELELAVGNPSKSRILTENALVLLARKDLGLGRFDRFWQLADQATQLLSESGKHLSTPLFESAREQDAHDALGRLNNIAMAQGRSELSFSIIELQLKDALKGRRIADICEGGMALAELKFSDDRVSRCLESAITQLKLLGKPFDVPIYALKAAQSHSRGHDDEAMAYLGKFFNVIQASKDNQNQRLMRLPIYYSCSYLNSEKQVLKFCQQVVSMTSKTGDDTWTIDCLLQISGEFALSGRYVQSNAILKALLSSSQATDNKLLGSAVRKQLKSNYAKQGDLARADLARGKLVPKALESAKAPLEEALREANALESRALSFLRQNKLELAIPLFKREAKILSSQKKNKGAKLAGVLQNLAFCLAFENKDEALECSKHASAAATDGTASAEEILQYAQTLDTLAMMYISRAKTDLARPLLDEELAILTRENKTETPGFALALYYFSFCLSSEKRYMEATKCANQALTLRKKLKMEDAGLTNNLELLSGIYDCCGRWAESVKTWKEAVESEKKTPRENKQFLANDYYRLGCVLWTQKQYSEAAPALKQALEIQKSLAGGQSQESQTCRVLVINALSQGKQLEALSWFRKINDLNSNDSNWLSKFQELTTNSSNQSQLIAEIKKLYGQTKQPASSR